MKCYFVFLSKGKHVLLKVSVMLKFLSLLLCYVMPLRVWMLLVSCSFANVKFFSYLSCLAVYSLLIVQNNLKSNTNRPHSKSQVLRINLK